MVAVGDGASGATPDISVIVPVYNSSKYLEKCLTSLLGQTYGNIEVICIDDGSTDESSQILSRFASEDLRLSVITQDNHGLATARNIGMASARAPYIMFCDSDDWFHPRMCEEMLGHLLEFDADAVTCGICLVFETDTIDKDSAPEYYRMKYSGLMDNSFETLTRTDVSSCNKIFRRSIIEAYNIRFPDGLHYEDAFFFNAYAAVSKTLFYLKRPYYFYLRHIDSIMSDTFSKSGRSVDHLEIAFTFFDFLQRYGLYEANSRYFWNRLISYYSFSILNADKSQQPPIRRRSELFYASQRENLFVPTDTLLTRLVKRLTLFLTGYPDVLWKLNKLKSVRELQERVLG